MAKRDNDFVDISSSADVDRFYDDDDMPRRKRGTGKRVFVLILSILMLLSGTVMVVGKTMLENVLNGINYVNDSTEPQAPSQAITETTTVSIKSGGDSLLSSDNVLNILLFGQDSKGDGEDYGRSDTMILMSIDNVHNKLKLTSFQRDTYVHIPGLGDDKINAAYSFGGEKKSIETIEANFGIKVDKYATVDFDAFRDIIKILGGVDIELSIEEIQYINAQIEVNGQENVTKKLTYDATKKKQMVHLDGYQALWFARNRGEYQLGGNPEYSFSGDDWDRTQRQRNLLETIIKSLRNDTDITKLVTIANKVGPYVTTNLTKGDITFLLTNMLTYMKYDMEQMSMPVEGTWRYGTTDDGQSVIVISDWDGARNAMARFIYEDAVSSKTTTATTSMVTPGYVPPENNDSEE
ncbi:LCP family protein [uncultured Ruminococcus sp.]|uniref:LCP family protein n=1 Tax=uncultured Ruminococcus sp. TaxID=165186 RepID=UPI002931D525|nr:LCP family protein [uncultured Ruminococcus sp.]